MCSCIITVCNKYSNSNAYFSGKHCEVYESVSLDPNSCSVKANSLMVGGMVGSFLVGMVLSGIIFFTFAAVYLRIHLKSRSKNYTGDCKELILNNLIYSRAALRWAKTIYL